MSEGLSDEQWRNILELAQAAVKYPKSQRAAFLEAAGSSPDVIRQVLVLTEAFEQPTFSTDRIGTQVGHFLITEHLGQGGMGDVYSARDVELERKVALKFLSPESMGLEGAGEKFIREARTASALNHPNIVTIHEVIRSDSTVAIVMELVDGVPLRQLCGTPLPLQRLLRIARQIADALAAAHAAGVVHRDMKPENVMVRADGRVKVLDFGLARRFGGDGKTTGTSVSDVFAGTWRYMSPEQVKGEALTGASDVFSFGLILYELATGRHPFQANSAFETLQAIASEDPTPPSKVNPQLPGNLESLILAMLAKGPAERPVAESVAQVLAEWETGQINTTVRDALWRPRTLRRRAWMLASLLLVLAIGGLLWRYYRSNNRPVKFYQVTTLIPENRATAASISPDGTFAAYANTDGIFLRAGQTGETNTLRSPNGLVVDKLAWFADGAKLIASGFSSATNQPSIWSISITGAAPQQLRTDAHDGIPSPDGTRIAFLSRDRSTIWVMGVNGEDPHIVLNAGDDTFPVLVWSPDGRRLAFQRRHYSGKQDLGFVMLDRYYKRSFELFDLDAKRIVANVPDFWIDSANSLPDGRILVLRMKAPGSNISNELWEVRTDSASGEFRGSPRKIVGLNLETNEVIYDMSATSDGRQVMVLKRTNQDAVFVADFSPSPPHFSNAHRLTLEERANYPHAWTADSKDVIFESDRNGIYQIFKQPIDQHTADTIIATPRRWDVLPQLAPDGRSVLYATGALNETPGPYTLMRVPVDGGIPQQVPTGGTLDEFRCAFHGRCVLRNSADRQYYVFYDLDPVQGVGREVARAAWIPSLTGDWTMSPDGFAVALPNHDSRSAEIRVLSWKDHPSDRELDLPGLTDLSELAWSADGSGWFVTLDTTIGKRMVYVYLDGRMQPLGDIQGWAVPSPDGHKVAYSNRIIASNAWIIDRR